MSQYFHDMSQNEKNTFFIYGLIMACICCDTSALDSGFGSILTSAKDITRGVAKDTANLLPTPQGLFESSKQVVAGYPFEFAATSINKICSSALSSDTLKSKLTPDIGKMHFELRTTCSRYSYPLLKADEMWHSAEFNTSKKVVILASGWTTNVNSDIIDVMAKAYNCRGDVNFIAVDVANFVDTLYTWAALNTEEIGENIAIGLVQLCRIVPVANIHLIGHSLGAHIVGAAARYFKQMTNFTIPRITGLDPAKPCFNEGEELSGLLRGDADFIDVIHSNPGVLGKRDPLGDVDFYPGGLDPLPPGCLTITCAHARAWRFFAETVYPGEEENFLAKRCSSLTRLREGKCEWQEFPMGIAAPKTLKGNFFLEVKSEEPFGMHSNSVRWKKHELCGKCNDH